MTPELEARKKRWCAVVGWEGRYEVSDDGQVRSAERRSSRHRVHERLLTGQLLGGYRRMCLSNETVQQMRFVHIMVAEAFLGPRPTSKHQVNHKDGKRLNNCVDNLEWVTPSENMQHAYTILGRQVSERTRAAAPKGEDHGRAKLTNAQYGEIVIRRTAGETCGDLAKAFGLHASQISRIARGFSCGLAGKP